MSQGDDRKESAHALRLLQDPLLQRTLDNMREACVQEVERLADLSDEATKSYVLERCRTLHVIAAFRSDLEGELLEADFERLNDDE